MPAGAEHGICGSPFPTLGCVGSLSEQKPHFGSLGNGAEIQTVLWAAGQIHLSWECEWSHNNPCGQSYPYSGNSEPKKATLQVIMASLDQQAPSGNQQNCCALQTQPICSKVLSLCRPERQSAASEAGSVPVGVSDKETFLQREIWGCSSESPFAKDFLLPTTGKRGD